MFSGLKVVLGPHGTPVLTESNQYLSDLIVHYYLLPFAGQKSTLTPPDAADFY